MFKWAIPNFAHEVRDENSISFRSPPLRIDNRTFFCIYVVRPNENTPVGRSHGIYLEICEGSIPVFVSARVVSDNFAPIIISIFLPPSQLLRYTHVTVELIIPSAE